MDYNFLFFDVYPYLPDALIEWLVVLLCRSGAAYWVVQWAMGVFSQYMDNLNILFKRTNAANTNKTKDIPA